jgi:hypothetical protein
LSLATLGVYFVILVLGFFALLALAFADLSVLG